MYQTTQALQMNVKFAQQDMLRQAQADHMARIAHKDDRAAFEHKLAAVAVALVAIVGMIVVF